MQYATTGRMNQSVQILYTRRDQAAEGMVKTTHNPVDPGEASAHMRPP